MEILVPDLNMTAVRLSVNGDSVKITQMRQSPALDDDARREIKESARLFPEMDFSAPGYTMELTSFFFFKQKTAYEIKVTHAGSVSTYYYDVNTGYKLR